MSPPQADPDGFGFDLNEDDDEDGPTSIAPSKTAAVKKGAALAKAGTECVWYRVICISAIIVGGQTVYG